MGYEKNYLSELDRLREELDKADAIIIGAGEGLSISAGLTFSGERFERYFSDFKEKYGFRNIYQGGSYTFPTPEEQWAYWSRYIFINRYIDSDNGTYKKLFELVKDRDYFVITTNVCHQLKKAGFDSNRLFCIQGDYGLFQCSEPYHAHICSNENTIRNMFRFQQNMKIPTELIPLCPVCGKPMTLNIENNGNFFLNDVWHKSAERYNNFIFSHMGQRIIFLELGVGFNMPVAIKYPFWKMAEKNNDAVYACINLDEAYAPENIREKSICINEDIHKILDAI